MDVPKKEETVTSDSATTIAKEEEKSATSEKKDDKSMTQSTSTSSLTPVNQISSEKKKDDTDNSNNNCKSEEEDDNEEENESEDLHPRSAASDDNDTADKESIREDDEEDDDEDEEEEAGQSSSSPPTAKFKAHDKVYCWDIAVNVGCLYEAIIRRPPMYGPRSIQSLHIENQDIDVDELDNNKESCWHYFVHFQGWNVKWDKWVEEHALLENTAETRKLSKQTKRNGNKKVQSTEKEDKKKSSEKDDALEQRKRMQAEKKKKSKTPKAKTALELKREQKLNEQELQLPRDKVPHADRLPLPFILKKVLVDEWEIIAPRQHGSQILRSLPDLPSKKSVKIVLDQYLQSKLEVYQKEGNEEQKSKWIEMVDGIALFFDQALPVHLLYPQEKPQHATIMKDPNFGRMRKCELYGCEHLLRLFVKLPQLLSQSNLSKPDIISIIGKVGDLVRFLQKNHSECFAQTYRRPVDAELTDMERKGERRKKQKVVLSSSSSGRKRGRKETLSSSSSSANERKVRRKKDGKKEGNVVIVKRIKGKRAGRPPRSTTN